MYWLPAQQLRLYRDFKAIRPGDFEAVIGYYEQHENAIRSFEFDAWFDCTLVYHQALYDAGQYGKHLVMCDYLAGVIMEHNLIYWGGEDWYVKILQQKAKTLVHLGEYQKAGHIFRELIKMDPDDKGSQQLLMQCLLNIRPQGLLRARALLVVLVLVVTALIATELFVLPLFPGYTKFFQWTHNGLLAFGVVVLLIAETRHYWRCLRAVRQAVARSIRKKKRSFVTNTQPPNS
jgi:tetratricopeptide (TPR) repeat protein